MSSKADKLGAGSFAATTGVSARRAAIAATTSAPTTGAPSPTHLPLGLISRNPDNPRETLGDLSGLESTLAEIGLIQPITVANVAAWSEAHPGREGELDAGARYLVIDGHRRHAAARNLGWDTIRASINDDLVASDETLLEAAFVANVQRANMTDLEEAQALQQLVKFYGSQRKAAGRLGISQAVISQRLSLLALTPDLQAELAAGERKVEHVRGLAGLPAEQQREAADQRAQAAKSRKTKAATQPSPAGSATTSATPPGDNGVITQGETSPSDNAVITQAVEAVPHSRQAADDRRPTVGPVPDLPWGDPLWFAIQLRRHMTQQERDQLIHLLKQED